MLKKCPRCHEHFEGMGATSRRDNTTEICPECGTDEAIFDFMLHERVRKERAWLTMGANYAKHTNGEQQSC